MNKVTLTPDETSEIYRHVDFWSDEWTPEATAAVESIVAARVSEALKAAAEPLERAGFQDIPDWLRSLAAEYEKEAQR